MSDFAPISAYAEHADGLARLYADPQFVQINGLWRRIDDVLTVQQLDGVYRIELDDQWIELHPAGDEDRAIMQGADEHVVEARQFGPVLDKSTLTKDTLDLTVSASSGVVQTDDGWEFGNAGGVRLGLFLRDWQETLGDQLVSVRDDAISLDVTEHLGQSGKLNLDPTVVYATAACSVYNMGPVSPWSTIRNASAGAGTTGVAYQAEGGKVGSNGNIYRLALRFNTSAYGASTARVLKLTDLAAPVGSPIIDATRATFSNGIPHVNCFGQVSNGWTTGSNRMGDFAYAAPYWSRAIPAAAWAATATFDVGVYEYGHDYSNVQPGSDYKASFSMSGSDAPRLELTMPDTAASGVSGSGTTTATAA